MQRGPKSAESQVVYVVPEAIPQRPEPPDHLSSAQKKQWNLYVERMPVDWFTAEVQPLLVNLCRAVCLSDYFMARLTEATTDLAGLETRLRQENPEISDKDLQTAVDVRQGRIEEYTRLQLANESRYPSKRKKGVKQRSGRQRCALYLRLLLAYARRRPAPPLFASMNSTPAASKARFTTSSVARLSLCTSSCLAVALIPALRTVVHSRSHSGTSTSSCLMGSNSSSG
jgi:hypothetical protein